MNWIAGGWRNVLWKAADCLLCASVPLASADGPGERRVSWLGWSLITLLTAVSTENPSSAAEAVGITLLCFCGLKVMLCACKQGFSGSPGGEEGWFAHYCIAFLRENVWKITTGAALAAFLSFRMSLQPAVTTMPCSEQSLSHHFSSPSAGIAICGELAAVPSVGISLNKELRGKLFILLQPPLKKGCLAQFLTKAKQLLNSVKVVWSCLCYDTCYPELLR